MTSIVIPTLNEALLIERTLRAVSNLQGAKEIIVADGGSEDETCAIAARCGARVVRAARGRGTQMHAGAMQARGDVFWFLHADTVPAAGALAAITDALRDSAVAGGNFTLVFEGSSFASRHLTWIYPKLRLLALSYGDAGIFVRRSAYEEIGGFRPLPLFEDVDLIQRIRKRGRFAHLGCRVFTSPRRFESRNYTRVWGLWIALQMLYWLGVSPERLAAWYRREK